jgi:hypothetical protein
MLRQNPVKSKPPVEVMKKSARPVQHIQVALFTAVKIVN